MATGFDNISSPISLRKIDDITSARQAIFDSVLNAAKNLSPVENNLYRLSLSDIDYIDPPDFSLAEQKNAILSGKTLARRLRGVLTLEDKFGRKSKKKTTLLAVPYLTPRGTFILNGVEYSIANQQRLRPGIFARQKETGDLEAHVNVASGRAHRYYLDPKTLRMRLQIGQAQIPLLPILQVLGADERQIRETWGDDIYNANIEKNPNVAIQAFYSHIANDAGNVTDKNQAIRAAFDKMKLDPEVMLRTLGKPYDKVNAETILTATKKLIDIYNGSATEDDRDALNYQVILGPEDLLAERLRKSQGILRRVLWKATGRGNLDHVSAGLFNPVVDAVFYGSGLGNSLVEINPVDLLDQQHRITRMGDGGLTSVDAIPESARDVHPTHLGFIDPTTTPENLKVGVEGRLTVGTYKGTDGRLYSNFINARTGQVELLDPQTLSNFIVAFPGELASGEKYVRAIVNNREQFVPRQNVDYELVSAQNAFGPLANLIPFKKNTFPQRIAMSSRFFTQALPLVNPEASFVRSANDSGEAYDRVYSSFVGAQYSPVSGIITDIKDNAIYIKDPNNQIHEVELYNNFPYARYTFEYNTPVVRIGQKVQKNDLLAKSNFTDEEGNVALGKNLRTAFLATGDTYEDNIVVSQSAAEKLRAEYAFQKTLDKTDNTFINKKQFVGIFPTIVSTEKLKNYDENGVIKPGTVVESGDPVILAVKRVDEGLRLGRQKRSWKDAAVRWDHDAPGIVTDTVITKNGVNVFIRSTEKLQDGDKIANLYGNKGVVLIRPDHEMPRDEEGNPYEVLINPLSVISRGNVGQIYATLLGKIANKRGVPYILDESKIKDVRQFVERELKRHGLKSTETLIDPETESEIPNVLTGNLYFLRLYHTAESKLDERGEQGAFTSEGIPTKGENSSSKRLGLLDLHALLSHGAYNVIADAAGIRGQANQLFWRQFQAGYTPPKVEVPFVWKKFLAQLQAAGINPVRAGSKIQIMALTNSDIDELAGSRVIKNEQTIDWRNNKLATIAGGLFDPHLTGGLAGTSWAKIKLFEPMPNPVMEEPIRRLLGLTQKEFLDVLAGKNKIDVGGGNLNTGPKAIQKALENIDLDAEIRKTELAVRDSRKTVRDQAVRKLQYLRAAKETGVHPKEWIWNSVPVLPPIFRPLSVLEKTGTLLTADANTLYKSLFAANSALGDIKDKVTDLSEERLNIYNAMKALVGLSDPIQSELQQKNVKGFLSHIVGQSPKASFMQRKLLGISAQLVGRGVITPNSTLDIDQIGIPYEMAWTLFKPFITRNLVRRGMSNIQALQAVKERKEVAKEALHQEMKSRPVIMNRAPVLHKYGIMAFRPIPLNTKTIQISPLITAPFGADFDGDAVQIHVPVSEKAVNEAYEKMLPSKNLISAANQKTPIYVPAQEFLLGLWLASKEREDKPIRTFLSKADVLKAFARGELSAGQLVRINEG